ncbi:MAG: beta strand repeat-containing protein, partial [Pirellula sp.]
IGGAGTDLAVYTGNWRDYTITTGSDGQGAFYQLVDSTPGRDGTDKLYNIENIQFADGTASAASLQNVAPNAVSDIGTAVEAGGISNGTAGSNASGNVLTNDTDTNVGDTKTVTGVAFGTVGSASTNVGSNVTGTYGTINIAANGSYTYTVDNSNATVQALRTSGNTLTDTFTYTMRDTAGLTSTTQITITIQGANDAPNDITGTLTVAENSSNGTSVGTVVGQDVDTGDTRTYSLVDSAGGRFAINSSTGQVTVADSSLLNFEAATSHNITVLVTDTAGATFDKVMAVSITNVNEAPTITAGYVHNLAASSEDTPSTGTLVSTILAGAGWSDPDSGALSGIAITSLTGVGKWQYSTDGISWTSISSVSSTNSLLLDSNTFIRYQPTTLLGETVSLGFRAWDQSIGTASTNALPSSSNSSTNGGSTAFSSQSATISLSVTDVNDAPQFGFGNGLVLVPAPDTQSARGVVVQSDGKVIVVGGTSVSGDALSPNVAVYRFNADGSVDTSFGNNGSAIIDFAADNDFGYDVKLQADGKIVIAAQTKLPGVASDYGIIRLNSDGTLDTSFGGTGKVTTAIGTATDIALTLAIQADGKIVAAGYSSSGNADWSAVRYNTDGSLDTSFGGTGKVVVPFGSGLDIAWGITIQSDGNILLGGSATMTDTDAAIVRLNADGSLDTSFGGTGQLTSGVAGSDWASAVALQGDGKILLGGTANGDMVVTRYLSSGVLDTTFGAAGRAIVDFDGRSDSLAYSVHVL